MNNNMDTPIERKSRLKKKHLYAMAGGAFLLVCLLYFILRDTSSSMKVFIVKACPVSNTAKWKKCCSAEFVLLKIFN